MARETREYIQRRGSPARRSVRRTRKQMGPPPIFYLIIVFLIALVLVIAILVIRHALSGRKSEEPEASSAVSSAASDTAPDSVPESSAESLPAESSDASSAAAPVSRIPEGTPEVYTGMVAIGDTGYETYSFSTDAANRYITAVKDAADQLPSGAAFYNLIVPTALDVLLPEDYILAQNISSSDQKEALRYLNDSIAAMAPGVKSVSLFDALQAHSGEDIFFRTDHNWTQLGAYYAYVEFCKAKGVQPVDLGSLDSRSYEGFLGSFYDVCYSDAMSQNRDTIQAWLPANDMSMYLEQANGETIYDWGMIQDGDLYAAENKYSLFSGGSQPYGVVTNHDRSDGSSAILVKDSFGSTLLPFLACHYETVYVVDPRYWSGDISDLAQEREVDDVILISGIALTASEGRIEDLENRF